MGGFFGDIMSPLPNALPFGLGKYVPRPKTSHERTLEKQAVFEAEQQERRQTLNAERRKIEAETRYRDPENVRQRAGYANTRAERNSASQYLGS